MTPTLNHSKHNVLIMAQMHRDDKGMPRTITKIEPNPLRELAYQAVIKELKRGNGRVGLAVLEQLGLIRPETQPSQQLTSVISTLLPVANVDNSALNPMSDVNITEGQPSKQPQSPTEHVELSTQLQLFPDLGLTPSAAHDTVPVEEPLMEPDAACGREGAPPHLQRGGGMTEPAQFTDEGDDNG